MVEAIIGLMGTIIGVIGTLIVQYFIILADEKKSKNKEQKEVLGKKYSKFKELYKTYKYVFASVYSIDIANLKTFDMEFILNIIKTAQKSFKVYEDILKKLINELSEDYYITNQLIDWDKLIEDYYKLVPALDNVLIDFILCTEMKIFNDKKVLEDVNLFKEISCKVDDRLKELNYNFQERLYKQLF